jgi:hypothetical protein
MAWRVAIKESTQPGEKKRGWKLKCGAVRTTLGSRGKRLIGQEDTKRGSERKRAKVS